MDTHITLGMYAVFVGLLCVFIMLFLVAKQKSAQAFNVWLVSGLTGVFLGATGIMAGALLLGYDWHKPVPAEEIEGEDEGSWRDSNSSGGGGGPGGAGARGPTPGAKQANAVPVDIWTAAHSAHQPLRAKPKKK